MHLDRHLKGWAQAVGALLLSMATLQCGRGGYEIIDQPWKHCPEHTPIERGAAAAAELGCVLFQALSGTLMFDSLLHYIPDSADITHLYSSLQVPAGEYPAAQVAEAAKNRMYQQFLETTSSAAVFHTSWSEARLDRMRIIWQQKEQVNTCRLIVEANSAGKRLIASVMCFEINRRWFLAEKLQFGV